MVKGLSMNKESRNAVNDIIRIIAMLLVIGVHYTGSLEYCFTVNETGTILYDIFNRLNSLGVPLVF